MIFDSKLSEATLPFLVRPFFLQITFSDISLTAKRVTKKGLPLSQNFQTLSVKRGTYNIAAYLITEKSILQVLLLLMLENMIFK